MLSMGVFAPKVHLFLCKHRCTCIATRDNRPSGFHFLTAFVGEARGCSLPQHDSCRSAAQLPTRALCS